MDWFQNTRSVRPSPSKSSAPRIFQSALAASGETAVSEARTTPFMIQTLFWAPLLVLRKIRSGQPSRSMSPLGRQRSSSLTLPGAEAT